LTPYPLSNRPKMPSKQKQPQIELLKSKKNLDPLVRLDRLDPLVLLVRLDRLVPLVLLAFLASSIVLQLPLQLRDLCLEGGIFRLECF